MTYQVQKTDAEWREQLTPEQFHVMREKGTERGCTRRLEGWAARATNQYLLRFVFLLPLGGGGDPAV